MRLLHSLDGPTDNLPYILVWGVQVKASLPLFCCAHKAASSVDVLQHLRGVRLADGALAAGALAAGSGIFSFASSIRSLTEVCWLRALPLSGASRRLPLRWFSLCFAAFLQTDLSFYEKIRAYVLIPRNVNFHFLCLNCGNRTSQFLYIFNSSLSNAFLTSQLFSWKLALLYLMRHWYWNHCGKNEQWFVNKIIIIV